jgi:hypothetical protein
MTADFIADPAAFSDDRRQQLLEAWAWAFDVIDADPVVALATVGTAEISAFLDGRPGTEER